MAKLTALQALNRVLKKIGEPTVSVLTSLSTIQQVAFDNLNEVLDELSQGDHTKPLELAHSITLLTGTSTYTPESNWLDFDRESFRSEDDKKSLNFLTSDEFDIRFPQGITSDRTGYPDYVTYKHDKFHFDKQPTSAENNKLIKYRAFVIPTEYATATATGTSWMPEGFDRTLLINYATWLTMEYMGHAEAPNYHRRVFGDPSNNMPEGDLSKFRRVHTQPYLKPRFTYQL